MKQFKLLLSLTFLFILNVAFAQESIDDMLKEYETSTLDRKMELFYKFYYKFDSYKKDSVLYYVNDLINEGVKHDNKDAIALANMGIGPYLYAHSLFDEAELKLEKARKHFYEVKNDTLLCIIYNSVGNSAFLQGKLVEAEILYDKSLEYANYSGREEYKVIPIFSLGRIYLSQGKMEEAKKMTQHYIDFNLANGYMRELASGYGLMGQLYSDQNENKKAIDYYTLSMESALASGNLYSVSHGYTNLAIAEYFSGEMEKSEQYFQLALAYRQKSGDKYYISEGFYNLGDFYYGVGKFESSRINYEKSLNLALESDNLIGQKDALVGLSSVFDTLEQKDNHIDVLNKIILTNEKLAEQQSYKEINALKLSHAQSEKEAIKIGGIREDKLYGQVAEYQSVFNNWIWVVFGCILLLLVFIYFFKKLANK